MASFFQPCKRSSKINLINVDVEAPAPPPPKKYANHTTYNGFNEKNINQRVTKFVTRPPKGDWRKKQTVCIILYTYGVQQWSWKDKSCEIYHFSHWGMRESISKRLSTAQLKSSFNVLPCQVRDELGITKETFVRAELGVNTTNTGWQSPNPFVRLYCSDCQNAFILKLLNNKNYGNLKTIEELFNNWDNVKIPDVLLDVVGCFICALDERVNMGPNKNSFFKDPTEHRKKFHAEKVFAELTRKQKENLRLIQKLLVSDGAEAEPMMTVTTPQIPTKDAPASSSSSSSSSQQGTGKFGHKTKYRFVDATFTEKLKINQKCTSDLQKMAKGFCLSVIHNSVNKCISESTTIELYETAYRGIYDHYIVQAEAFEQMRGGTSATTLATPQKCSLNKNNIEVRERSILEAYEASTDSIILS